MLHVAVVIVVAVATRAAAAVVVIIVVVAVIAREILPIKIRKEDKQVTKYLKFSICLNSGFTTVFLQHHFH